MGFNPCCCMTLNTGGFVIGILQIVLGSISLVVNSFALAGFVSIKCLIENGKFQQYIEQIRFDYPGIMESTDLKVVEESVSLLVKLMTWLVVLSVLTVLAASVLIHGIRMQRSSLLKFWLLYALCDMIATLLLTVWMVETENGHGRNLNLFLCLSGTVVDFYFICVVYHLYEEIRDGRGGGGSVSTPKL